MWSVFFVFLSYLDRNFVKGDFLGRALDAEKESKDVFSMLNGTFCAKMSTVREHFLYQVSDGAEVVRSVVSPAGRLVNCSVIASQMQVKSFMHECRLGLREQRAGRQMETLFARMDEAKLICQEFKERSGRSGRVKGGDTDDSALQDTVLKRSKRGFTYPGTLWCGAGNMADHYDQLGEFAATDSCCRVHDHCPHVIHAFSSKYGHTNFKWHSICHCDCDNALKDCLRKVNDTSSRVVGQAFFNVIGVPCFEFAYEEQCAERHWYGMCKRYEKLPVAVLKEAVPYDFGGIDVIDVLTLAPPKSNSKKSQEEDKLETTTQSTMSGPDEPSLRNVVTAAEDFIKVLATVSTSQSSTADSDKSETQNSEKKKRKNTGKKKKTTKKQKGKGKGRKRKQKAEVTPVKVEEGAAPSGIKAEEVSALSNFLSEPHKHNQSDRSTNRARDNEYELGGKEEPSNEVMKDEPAIDKETVSITPPTTDQKKPAEITRSTTSTITVVPRRAKARGLRKRGRKTSKTISFPSEELVMNATDVFVTTIVTITPAAQAEQQSFHSTTEKPPVVSTAGTPIVISKVQRNMSKERRDRLGRKKRRKHSSASPIVATPHGHSSVDNLKVIPPSGAPIVLSVPTDATQLTEREISHRLDIYGGKMNTHVTSLNTSFSVLKRRKGQERRMRSRRRKTVLHVSSENPLFHNNSENVLPVFPTPETNSALNSPAATAAVSRPTEKKETDSEWRLFATITEAPSFVTERHGQTIRQQANARKKVAPADLSDGDSVLKQTEQTPLTFSTTPVKVATAEELSLQRSEKTSMTTSAALYMSAVQLSIEKAQAQFNRKKRRKAALTIRQQ